MAEQGVLGCILLSPRENTSVCLDRLKCGSEAFYDVRNRALYELLVAMHNDGKPVDFVTINNAISKSALEAVGNTAYLLSLEAVVPSAANLGYYLDILIEKYVLRKAYEEFLTAKSAVMDSGASPSDVIDHMERMAMRLRSMMVTTSDCVDIRDRLSALIDVYQKAEKGERIPSVPTGFNCIDKEVDGFRAGELIAIGARPKIGKSTLGLNIAHHATKHGYPVGLITLEMTGDEVLQRLVAAESEVPSKHAERGYTNDAEKRRMVLAMAKIVALPLMIQDTFTMNVDQISIHLRKWKKEKGMRLAIIDYLQLIDRPRGSNPNEAISEITRKLKNIAGDLGIAIVIISQFSREVEKENRPPRLSDFRDSGSIEQDANLILMIHRSPNEPTTTKVIMVGRRCKSSDDGTIVFHKEINRFENPPTKSHE